MTEAHRPAGPTGSAGGSDPGGGEPSGERVVIKDKRKVNPAPNAASVPNAAAVDAENFTGTGTTEPNAEVGAGEHSSTDPVDAAAAEAAALTEPASAPAGTSVPPPLGAELASLRSELDERTADLQRVTAEYANYRKRVDRDRALVVEQATGTVLATLLPVLDDLDRAREHGDLVGPFAGVAEQLVATLTKFGLTPFGAKGDPFDPTRHEAVAHSTSAEVTESTCVDVMRRGYLLGERLLRPALVAVADPE